MKRLALLALLLALGGCVRDAPLPSPPAQSDASTQVLVMLARPASTLAETGYGGQAAQAVSERLRRVAAVLAHDYRLTLESDWPMQTLHLHCFVFRLQTSDDIDAALGQLRRDRRVDSAQPMQTFHVLSAPDPYAPLQRNLAALHLPQRSVGGHGVTVALIDTGLDTTHPDLAGRLAATQDFADRPADAPEIHATALAGIIAADADNGIGMRGVAPLAKILPLRACRALRVGKLAARCDSLALARALDYAILARVQVINLSLAGSPDTLLARLIDTALRHGIVVVAAEETPADFPASLPGVIAVQASEHASAPGLAAPGVDVLGTAPGGSYDWFTGASFAAAEVSGIVALLCAQTPGLTPAQVAQKLHAASQLHVSGARGIDACAALADDCERNMAMVKPGLH
jgi:hypothetical protein